MKKLIVFITVLNLTFFGLYLFDRMRAPKTAYIQLTEVFNNFELKKDYERKFMATKSSRQRILDSLQMELKVLGKKIESENGKDKEELTVFSAKRDNFFEKKRLYEEDNLEQTKKYDAEILTQLNQFVKDYGKEQGYAYIYGNDGNGSLMYAEDTRNITREVTDFINGKYKGIQ